MHLDEQVATRQMAMQNDFTLIELAILLAIVMSAAAFALVAYAGRMRETVGCEWHSFISDADNQQQQCLINCRRCASSSSTLRVARYLRDNYSFAAATVVALPPRSIPSRPRSSGEGVRSSALMTAQITGTVLANSFLQRWA